MKQYGYGPELMQAAPGTEFDYRRILEVIRKRIWIILIAVVGMMVTATVLTLNKPHFYTASAKIAFASSRPQQMDIYRGGNVINDYAFYNPLFLKNQIEILKSDGVLRKVVRQLGLVAETEPENSLLLDQQARSLRASIVVRQVENTSLLKVTAVSGSAKEAFSIAKTTSEIFVEDNLERQVEGYKKNLKWLTDQLVDLENKLETAQTKVIEFVEKEKLTKFGDQEIGPGKAKETEEESAVGLAARLKEQRLEVEFKLARLQERYLDGHPQVVATKNELARINQRVETQKKLLSALRTASDRQIIKSKQKEIQYEILTSKVENYKQIYNAMIRKLKEMDIGSSVIQNNVSIIEQARLPHYPAGPNKRKRLLYSFIASLIFAFSLAFIVDYLDNTIRDAEEAERALGLPVLASVPLVKKIPTEGEEEAPLLALSEEDEQLREAFRVLRTNLRFSMPARGSHSLLVTSTKKGEGKSTFSANLGLASAESGKKTIVVDCDLRIPYLHRIFRKQNSQGLTNYLAESVAPEQLIQKTDIANLDILPSGPESPKPTALLESDNMAQLIPLLKDSYEMVIIDAPPVGMVIDTSVIAALAEGILLVIEAKRTNRYHVHKALEQLTKAKATVHGLALNKLTLSKKQYLSYYGYYYQGYGKKA